MILTIRHFETEKNSLDIHGISSLDYVTDNGILQANKIASMIRNQYVFDEIVYFPTPQCKSSAELLSKLTQIKISKKPLSLAPFDMGIADGLSNQEIKLISYKSFQSLQLFRERLITAIELDITDSENHIDLELRLLNWWNNKASKEIANKIIIGSNSTLIMLTNLLINSLPSSGSYKCFDIPNGSFRFWSNNQNLEKSFPDITQNQIITVKGKIQTSIYHSNWQENNSLCIICPGYFGNSRLGPYSLYVKIARNLNQIGIDTILFDFLGSGESTKIERSYKTDLFSIESVLENYPDREVILLGHSMTASLVANIASRYEKVTAIGLAPLVKFDDLKNNFFTKNELNSLFNNSQVIRRGIHFSMDYIYSVEHDWSKFKRFISKSYIAEKDQYSSFEKTKDSQVIISNADHSFSVKESGNHLILELTKLLKNLTSYSYQTKHLRYEE